jgi:RecB family exonuclease
VHGTVIHKILHLLHTEDWSLNIDYLYQELFDQEEFNSDESHIPIFWKDDRDDTIKKLKDEALVMLRNYRTKDYNLYSETILSEAKFTVKLGRAGLFSGTIDLLRRNPDGELELIDFKTSQFPPSDTFLNVDYQLGIYAYACWQGVFKMPDGKLKMLNIPPEELSIIYYNLRDHLEYKRNGGNGKIGDEKGDPRRFTSRTKEQLSRMKRDLGYIVSNIHRMSFPRNPNWATCPFCQFAETCAEDSQGELLNRNERKAVQELINQNKEIAYDET